jgi:hypothetical protein
MIVVSIWREKGRNKVYSGCPVFQQSSQKRKSFGYEIFSEPNKLQNEPKKIAELIKSNLHNIAMQHLTGSFMPRILDSEEKRKRRSWLPLNKKSQMFSYIQKTRGWIKALQSRVVLYHRYFQKYKN